MKTEQYNRLLKGRIDSKDGEYGMINRSTLHELSLRIPKRNVTTRMVYILLLTWADDNGVCWPSHSTLARILNVNRDAIVKAFRELRERNFIKTRNSPATKSLKVQIYSVPHKLIFPDKQKMVNIDEDDFPEMEDDFLKNNIQNIEKSKNTCMPVHTSNCMSEHTPNCTSEQSDDCMVKKSTVIFEHTHKQTRKQTI